MQQIAADSHRAAFVPVGSRPALQTSAAAAAGTARHTRAVPGGEAGLAAADRAVVVFAEATHMPKLRRLKPGFRHCYAFLRLPQGWIAVESLSHRLEIRHLPGWTCEVDLAAGLRRQGHCALTVAVIEPPRRLAPPLPFSCVETVKRLIGLHSWSIRTPWELFLHIRKNSLDYVPEVFYMSQH